MNLWLGLGNLTRDPEMKYSANGKAYTRFSLAINEKFGEKESVQFFNCVAFGPMAENIAERLRKGHKVMVEGRVETQKYTDKEGVERRSTNIVVNRVEFLTPVKAGGPRPRDEETDIEIDELPF